MLRLLFESFLYKDWKRPEGFGALRTFPYGRAFFQKSVICSTVVTTVIHLNRHATKCVKGVLATDKPLNSLLGSHFALTAVAVYPVVVIFNLPDHVRVGRYPLRGSLHCWCRSPFYEAVKENVWSLML